MIIYQYGPLEVESYLMLDRGKRPREKLQRWKEENRVRGCKALPASPAAELERKSWCWGYFLFFPGSLFYPGLFLLGSVLSGVSWFRAGLRMMETEVPANAKA